MPAADPDARNAHGPQLIAYADRMGGDLAAFRRVLTEELGDVFDGVHLLPFYLPYDGADAGFDPEDHMRVDPRLGTWEDVGRIASERRVMADLIVNHISSSSEQFRRFVAEGDECDVAPLFLTLSSIFPDGATEDDLARIYRPRPGLPFTPMTAGGRRRLLWTTFTSRQVDLDVRTPQFWKYLTGVIDTLVGAGVTMLRLDAVGYAGKQAGTDCFMTEGSTALVERISDYAHGCGAQVLLEVHGHHELQVQIARSVDYVYDFALPPLLLHALTRGDTGPLADWLAIRPSNTITVLDTHDGIGIIDVASSDIFPARPGLLDSAQLDSLVATIHANSRGTSLRATGEAASNLDLYQVNCTYYDALGGDDAAFLIARLVQLFLPGIPQIYYVGLFTGSNDVELLERTGVGRDVNRAQFGPSQRATALARPAVRRQLEAIRLRSRHPAFEGGFDWRLEGSQLSLQWRKGAAEAGLVVDVAAHTFSLSADGLDVPLD